MRTTLSILLVLLNISFSIAQQQKTSNHQFYYTITVEAADDARSYKKTLENKEAADFDVLAFLNAQSSDTRVRIYGRQITNTSNTTFSFDSKKLENKEDCASFCQKIESVERSPFLGVAVLPTDDFSGVEIDYLLENSPLHTTGIEAGDIITSVELDEVTNPCELISAVSDQGIDNNIDLHFFRGDASHSIKAKVGYRLKKKVTWTNCCELEVESKKMDQKGIMALKVFPNPSSGLVQFNFSTPNSSEATIRLADFNGRMIASKKVVPLNGLWSDYFDLSSFGPGVYTLQIQQQEQVLSQRVVIIKE